MEFKGDEQKEQKQRASDERAERAKERSKGAIEWQELKVAQKRKHVNVSSSGIVDIHLAETNTSVSTEDVEDDTGLAVANMPEMELAEPSCSTCWSTSDVENQAKGRTPEILKDTETQTKEFASPDREYFRSDDKVRFYTGLPSYQIVVTTLNHAAPCMSRRTQALDPFQEFIIVLIKLCLKVSFQDLAYCFLVSVATVSQISGRG